MTLDSLLYSNGYRENHTEPVPSYDRKSREILVFEDAIQVRGQ